MLKATKVRLYPTKEQQHFLCGQFGAVRFCYNKSIDIWQHRYKVHGQSVSIFKDVKPLLAVAESTAGLETTTAWPCRRLCVMLTERPSSF